ncbi:MAG: hypothetical protein K6E19_00165 [Lachnospiraceae bacterium]|nr:hypothetical protein [Lachnospiraceae bacterium]
MTSLMTHTKVVFQTDDPLVQKLSDSAEQKCIGNIRDFAGYKVLIEGGGYEKVWIETQPMGGAMYAKRNLEVALNNQKIFMDHQRADGRLPGSIEYSDGRLIPQFDKFQGFCFPDPALDVWYLTGKDPEFLERLYEVLIKYDDYLWAVRDSDGDGCLESWGKYDTGEDNAERYADAPNAWDKETPPEGFKVVPMASMDFMSFSVNARETLSAIAMLLGKEELSSKHKEDAIKVRNRIKEYLWDENRGAFFDRDKDHKMMPSLIHNNLRMMYWKSMGDKEAERFVKEHLINPREFWTKMPLPSVSVIDPLFRNERINNWSGQPEALTYQRAIRALENYGYYSLIPVLGNSLFRAIGEECVFVQQYDPFTGKPSSEGTTGPQDAYGPALLSVLEYVSRMFGVDRVRDKLIWGSVTGADSKYEQYFGEDVYTAESVGNKAFFKINGREIWSGKRGVRLETDFTGKVLSKYDMQYS